MYAKQRITIIRLIEKIARNPDYARQIGIGLKDKKNENILYYYNKLYFGCNKLIEKKIIKTIAGPLRRCS